MSGGPTAWYLAFKILKNAATNENEAMLIAPTLGLTDQFTIKVPNVNPALDDNEAIRLASLYGHTDIVRMLLERPEVNPTAHNNQAIRLASLNGRTDVVCDYYSKDQM